MRTIRIIMAAASLAISGCAARMAPARIDPAAPWTEVTTWPTPAAAESLGQVTGLDIDRAGLIYAFHRAERRWPSPNSPFPEDSIRGDTVAVLDADGRLVRHWGRDLFIMPHGLSLDRDGNVWVTDVGAHQVRKFTANGQLLLTLGERGKPGNDAQHFNLPTDVAFGPDGTVFVSDGYENTRVVRFSPQGRYLGEWGTPGDGPGQFNLPHGIAVDKNGRIYVADRDNFRLQVFDYRARYLTQWGKEKLGDPYGVSIGPDGSVYVIDGGFQPDSTRVRVLHFARNGSVIASQLIANGTQQSVLGHDLAVAADGTVYVADVWANRIRKLVVRR